MLIVTYATCLSVFLWNSCEVTTEAGHSHTPQRGKSRQGNLQPGMKAPDFTVKVVGSEQNFTLSSNFGNKPTMLIFGSYT